VAQFFKLNGYPDVFALEGGWSAWIKADFPLEEK
jgi:3-mercaptopyruvate sulfurtransferase SseA